MRKPFWKAVAEFARRPRVRAPGALALLCAAAVGCATDAERQAWREYEHERTALEGESPDLLPSHSLNPASAQEGEAAALADVEGPALEDYLRYALLNNPGLRASFERWQAALERVPQARALPEPRLSYGYYVREVETRVGPQKQSFSLSQTIPWPSRLTDMAQAALLKAQAEKYAYEGAKLNLFYRVKRAFYEYYYLIRSIDVMEENIQLLSQLESVIQARYTAGSEDAPALIQVQVELGKLEDRLRSLKALKPALAAELNAAIGRESGAPVPAPSLGVGEAPALEQEALRAVCMEDNPDLRAAREKILAAEAQESVADTGYYPDFGIGATYIQTDRRSGMDIQDNGKDPILLSLQVSLPLWFGKYDAAAREARAAARAATRDREELQNKLSADLAAVLFRYEDAARKLNLYRDTLVPKAEQSLNTARRAFIGEKAGFLDMIDAERELLEFRLSAERAVADQWIGLAELEMLCGRALRDAKEPPAAE